MIFRQTFLKESYSARYLLLSILFFYPNAGLYGQGEIKLNQIGFYPGSPKIAIVPGNPAGAFAVIDSATEEIVYAGKPGPPLHWEFSNEMVAQADFSDLTEPGRYRVVHEGTGSSYDFEIWEGLFRELSKASIKAFYFNRASTELKEEHAGVWARPAGHTDNVATIHASAATEQRPEGTIISSPKGWYDAGDYNKYAVNSGISTYTLLAAYEHFPEYYKNLELNIPETGNGTPDLLNEIRWNLDWLLTIQDPYDGGVYHKLTSLDFAGVVMPHEDGAGRYAVMKTTAATLNFVAVMAVAARVYGEYDPDFSSEVLAAAKYAWKWATANPDVYYVQPDDVHTGAYGNRELDDEFDWAAAELYITTGNDEYWYARNFDEMVPMRVPSWSYVRPLAWISLAHHRNNLTEAAVAARIDERMFAYADELLEEYKTSAYGISMGRYQRDFVWGSNGVAGNHSLILLQAYRLNKNKDYLHAALSNLDYMLGRNATDYSFVTGFGSKQPMRPHHRQSAADDIEAPVPGFIVGGPQPGQQDGCEYPSEYPATSFLDHWCSYSTNEVAINWNAPFVYVTGAIDYIFGQE